ncbi:MAG TPA: hypothetical protein VMI75_12310 [Polyangiaceae bacterium]|nr:hypothetical protein [Polyangiaceae bacterium]
MRLVATWTRWAVCAGALAGAFVAAVEAYLVFTRSERTLASFAAPLALGCAAVALLVMALLRAEESRVARELRTARTGTEALRGLVLRRRSQAPFFARLFSTGLGTAAVCLAEGDSAGAMDARRVGSALMRGGRLDALAEVVDADVERCRNNSVSLERCVQRLRAMSPLPNREAELYRLHVLVKALLQQGDDDGAAELVEELEKGAIAGEGPRGSDGTDDDRRMYATWLRVWFDMDAPEGDYRTAGAQPIPEGDLRMAALVARSQGAEKLLEKIEARLSSVAQPASSG